MSSRITFAGAPGATPPGSPTGFVDSDVAQLATHMQRCARSRGRLFALRDSLQTAQAMASGRIVTLALLAVVVAAGMFSVL